MPSKDWEPINMHGVIIPDTNNNGMQLDYGSMKDNSSRRPHNTEEKSQTPTSRLLELLSLSPQWAYFSVHPEIFLKMREWVGAPKHTPKYNTSNRKRGEGEGERGRAGAGRQTGIGKEILSVVCIWNEPDISY